LLHFGRLPHQFPLLLGGQGGQAHHELAALARPLAVGGDAAAVHLHQPAHQGQANAQAALGAVQAALGLHEQVEDAGQHVRRDADARVPHPQHQLAPLLPGRQ
jgi:hypothetical protein